MQAAHDRLRPILMAAVAFVFGVSPLLVAAGAGAMSRHSIGTTVFAGILVGMSITIIFIPLFFTLMQGYADRRRRRHATQRAEER